MKRKIIKIDEELCDGCGQCIPNCPEGALQVTDGKARMISDLFCDGLGACIGHCPKGAIKTEEREAQPYDESKVMENIVLAGEQTIIAHLKHLKNHGETRYLEQAKEFLRQKGITVPEIDNAIPYSCPGSKEAVFQKENPDTNDKEASKSQFSELGQWPVQLKLVNPEASFFKEKDLLITADCVPFAYGNFHKRFLKGKNVVVFCPKLDSYIETYTEKLARIIKDGNLKSLAIVRMEVPCCGGTTKICEEAVKKAGKTMMIKEYVVSLEGEII